MRSIRPRLSAPVHPLTPIYQILDAKYGRALGTYATLAEARTARGTHRGRYSIDTSNDPRFQAGPCSWCGWTSPLHVVKTAAADDARNHRAQHTAPSTSPVRS